MLRGSDEIIYDLALKLTCSEKCMLMYLSGSIQSEAERPVDFPLPLGMFVKPFP